MFILMSPVMYTKKVIGIGAEQVMFGCPVDMSLVELQCIHDHIIPIIMGTPLDQHILTGTDDSNLHTSYIRISFFS